MEIDLKKPKEFKEQLDILKSRNLIIDDEDAALSTLSNLSYYRLSGYMLTLKKGEYFKEGVTFNNIYELYEFDRKLRNLLLQNIEQIEIVMRTQIAYHMSHKYGEMGYRDPNHFADTFMHTGFISELEDQIRKSKEHFVAHHTRKYDSQFPIWVAIELFSMGMLSKFFKNMKMEDKKVISKHYGIPFKYLENWLHVLTFVRNNCAHYARIYNKKLTVKAKLFKEAKFRNDKLLATVYIIKRLCWPESMWVNFYTQINALLEEYDNVIEFHHIGFVKDWDKKL